VTSPEPLSGVQEASCLPMTVVVIVGIGEVVPRNAIGAREIPLGGAGRSQDSGGAGLSQRFNQRKFGGFAVLDRRPVPGFPVQLVQSDEEPLRTRLIVPPSEVWANERAANVPMFPGQPSHARFSRKRSRWPLRILVVKAGVPQ
jgi:hypothetical protein